MSVGRVEIVEDKKEYVRYATIGGGGSGGVPVGNVKDLSFENGMNGIHIRWKDPDDIVFNGDTTAQWSGTKVVRKEGSFPVSADDGVLVVDSKVRNQYSADTGALVDSDIAVDVQYNYTLFPYTAKNIYTMSDVNKGYGFKNATPYDKILANNTWAEIDEASRAGIAGEIWNLGDEKDGYIIVGFDHDDLNDGSGKAGITFALSDSSKSFRGDWFNTTTTSFVSYAYSKARTQCNTIFDELPEEIKSVIKTIKKKCISGLVWSPFTVSYSDLPVTVFLFSRSEIDGTGGREDGECYKDFPKIWNFNYWTRSPSCDRSKEGSSYRYDRVHYVSTSGYFSTADSARVMIGSGTTAYFRYGFCI